MYPSTHHSSFEVLEISIVTKVGTWSKNSIYKGKRSSPITPSLSHSPEGSQKIDLTLVELEGKLKVVERTLPFSLFLGPQRPSKKRSSPNSH